MVLYTCRLVPDAVCMADKVRSKGPFMQTPRLFEASPRHESEGQGNVCADAPEVPTHSSVSEIVRDPKGLPWAWLTQAPNHSSWNPIEKSWPIPRRLFTGQHLGRSAYPPGVDPMEGEEPKPDVYRKIAQAGVKDAFKLLNTQKENGWHVYAPDEPTDPAGNPAPLPTEYVERVRAHYTGKTWDNDIAKEASIIFDHTFKLFNVIYFRMCIGDTMCPHCTQVTRRRERPFPPKFLHSEIPLVRSSPLDKNT